jgi:signal peptidase I
MYPPPPPTSEEDHPSHSLLWGVLRELVETVLPAVLIAIFITLFLAQATQVYGQSMEPNLHAGQRLIVEKISYRFHSPRRGDIVVLRLPEQRGNFLIKRVIGLPGETVEVRDQNVLINGHPIDESYLDQPIRYSMSPRQVPEDSVFVLGDNRGFSNDSRSFGPVAISNIIGRAWIRYWPPERMGLVY